MHAHTVGIYATPTPAAPHVAVGIAANTIRKAGLKICKHLATTHGRPIFYNVEDDDISWIIRSVRCTGINNIDLAEVGRKTDTIWSAHRSFSDYRDLAGMTIDAINPRGQFKFCLVTFVGSEDAIAWIGKPDGAIPMNCRIVGCVELFALVAVAQYRPGSIVLAPANAPRVMNDVTPEESKIALQGMTANFGTWSIDEGTKTLTTNIEAASSPNLIGGTQKRIITSLTADELKYTNPASQIGTVDDVVWKRSK